MPLPLKDAMREVLADWPEDLDPAWRAAIGETDLGFEAIDPGLTLEPWEPVFPVRRGKQFPGAPRGAHIFRAFENIAPSDVKVVVLGQDPYPCAAFSTGRAFEAGNIAEWRELEKMFSISVRTFMLLIVAARSGDESYLRSVAEWPRLRDEIEAKTFAIEPASTIADRWVSEGVLLLNSALTLTRFAVAGDPHQIRGHLPLWRPLLVATIRYLVARGAPLIIIGFGRQAADTLTESGVAVSLAGETQSGPVVCILREHPARGNEVLALPNPFVIANRRLAAMKESPVSW
jgi:uracil-DNA glycosylase